MAHTTRSNLRRTALVASGATLGILGLAGCSGADETAAEGEQVSLLIQDGFSEPNASVMEDVYSACADKLNVDVEVSHVAGSGVVAKVLQQASSKTLPDIINLDNPDVQQIASSGALAPLSDYDVTADGFNPAVTEAGSYEDELYALVPVMNTLALIYNVDVLEEAGVEVPTTWDELKEVAAALTTGDRYGLSFSATNSPEGTWQFLPFMWSNGGDEANIATTETAEALQLLLDLVEAGSASQSVVTWGQADALDQFTAGNAAMMINGPWTFRTLQDAEGLKWESASIPTPDGAQPIVPMGGQSFAIGRTGDEAKMETSAKFVECIAGRDSQITMAENKLGVPASPDVAEEVVETVPEYAPYLPINEVARARTAKLGVDWPEAATQIYTALQLTLTGSASPMDALEQAQEQ